MNRPTPSTSTSGGGTPAKAGNPAAPPAGTPGFWRVLGMGMLFGFVLAMGLLGLVQRPRPAPVVVHAPPTPLPIIAPTPAPIKVHVSGAVARPGLYTLPAGARVNEAVEAAGGLAAEADGTIVNLAAFVADGARLHVVAVGEQPPPEPTLGVGLESRAGSGAGIGAPINVNTATQAELETLPGIGPAKAEAIIAARPFVSVEDLDRVPGIGDASLEELRPLVFVR